MKDDLNVEGSSVLGYDFSTIATYVNKIQIPAIISDGSSNEISIASDGFNVDEGPAILLDGRNVTFGTYDNGDVYAGLKVNHTNNQTDDLLEFRAGNSTRMVVSGSGDVGIGTTTPVSKLDVNGVITLSGDTEHQILRSTSPAWGLNSAQTTFIYGRNVMLNSYDDVVLRAGSSDDIRMYAGDDSNPRITVLSSGNVGIGTTSPIEKLHVDGAISSSFLRVDADEIRPGVRFDGTDASGLGYYGNQQFRLGHSFTARYISFTTVSSYQIIDAYGNTNNRLSLRSNNVEGIAISGSGNVILGKNGNVGVNIETPTEKLHVSGNILTENGSVSSLQSSVGVTTTATGAFDIYAVPTGSYDGAFFDYTAKSGSNARAGSIQAIWLGTEVNFNESVTMDFGDTSGLSLDVSISGSNMVLTGSCDTVGWELKVIARSI